LLEGEVDFFVNFSEGDLEVGGGGGQAAEADGGGEALGREHGPSAVVLAEEGENGGLFGRDEDDFAEGLEVAVAVELVTAVVGLGGLGEDFDDEGGVGEGGLELVGGVELRFAADDGEVGVDVVVPAEDRDAGVGLAGLAGVAAEAKADGDIDVMADATVAVGAAGHHGQTAESVLAAVGGAGLG